MCPDLLQDGLEEIQDDITDAPSMAVFLDYDGTLAPIVTAPSDAWIDGSMRNLLSRFARRTDVLTAVVSGRSLTDLRARVDIAGLIYAGNHGMEIAGDDWCIVEPTAASTEKELRMLCEEAEARLQQVDGAWVEFKGFSASVHYRTAAASDIPGIDRVVAIVIAGYSPLFRARRGRKVIEITPCTTWHKGTAARWIQQCFADDGALAVYIGDDAGDEDAFEALPDAITVKVGSCEHSIARYHVSDPADVRRFLAWLLECRTRG